MSTSLIVPYGRHPLSCALPTYKETQLNELADSIKLHGLKHKIVLCDGMILDGWNRLMACGMAQVAPDFRELMVDETAAFVVLANNIDRRDLTKVEKAFAVVDIFFIVNGIWSRSTHDDAPHGSSAAPLHWSQATIWKQTKAQLAARAGVKPRTMQDVLRIRSRGEQRIIDAMRSGEISVEDAAPMVGLDIDGQYLSLQNHCEYKKEQQAKRVEKKREEAAARAEKKRACAEGSVVRQADELSAMEGAANSPLTRSSTELQNLRMLLRQSEMSLNSLCDVISGSNVLDSCESDSTALAAACREYLALTGVSPLSNANQSVRTVSSQRGAQY